MLGWCTKILFTVFHLKLNYESAMYLTCLIAQSPQRADASLLLALHSNNDFTFPVYVSRICCSLILSRSLAYFFFYKKVSDLLIAVVGVNVLQWDGHQVRRDVPIDKGKGFPRLQITVGLRPVFIVGVAAVPCPWSPGLLLRDAPLNGGQRLGDEGAEAVRSGRFK